VHQRKVQNKFSTVSTLNPGLGSIYAPKGLQHSAQGFNPGNPQTKRFALKGREMRYQTKLAPIAAQKSESTQLGRVTIGPPDPASTLLGHSIWRPVQGPSLLVGDSQGWNPGLSPAALRGTKTRASAQGTKQINRTIELYTETIVFDLAFN
jgi:hypothetical protein